MGQGSGIIVAFIRVYIVIGFIVAILINVYIIRLIFKMTVLLEKSLSLLEVITHQPVNTPDPHAELASKEEHGHKYPPGR